MPDQKTRDELSRLVSVVKSPQPRRRGRKKYTKKALEALRVRQHEKREARTQYDNPHQVITIEQFAALASLSVETTRRIIRQGDGPPTIQLTSSRRGIRMGEANKWLDARSGE